MFAICLFIWIATSHNLNRINLKPILDLPLPDFRKARMVVEISLSPSLNQTDLHQRSDQHPATRDQADLNAQQERGPHNRSSRDDIVAIPPVDTVMGVAVGYSYNHYEHVIKSFTKWAGPNQALILFTDSQANITPNVWCIDYRHFYQGAVQPVVKQRFYMYEAFLTSGYASSVLGSRIGRMFFIDVRDLFFQGDVFARFVEPGIHLFAENYLLEYEPVYNQPWVRDCRGQEFLDAMIRDRASIINGGVWAASNVTHFERFMAHLKPMLETCNDQGALTILGYVLNVSTHSSRVESWVTHLPIEHVGGGKYAQIPNPALDSLGRLCGPDGRPYALVHQGDRWEWLWSIRLKNMR